jgi:hypothetical protein
MKVKELIAELQKYDGELEVKKSYFCPDGIERPVKIDAAAFHNVSDQDIVVIE